MKPKTEQLTSDIQSLIIGSLSSPKKAANKEVKKAPEPRHPSYDRGRPKKDAVNEFDGMETIHRSSVVFVKEQYDKLMDIKWSQRITFQGALFDILQRGIESYEKENGPISH